MAKHTYDAPELELQIKYAVMLWGGFMVALHAIQTSTGIAGLHTGIEDDDQTPAVLERIQFMYDAGEYSLEAFKLFDEEG